jgi:hypothetical protein
MKSKRGAVEDRVPVGFERKDAFTLALHLELEHEPTPSQPATVHFRPIYFSVGCWEVAVIVLSKLLMQFRCEPFDQFVTTVMLVCQYFLNHS